MPFWHSAWSIAPLLYFYKEYNPSLAMLDTLTPIILTLIPVFGIMLVGAFAQSKSLLPSNTVLCLNQFVYWFGLPMLLFYAMATSNEAQVALLPVLGCVFGLLLTQAVIACVLRWMNFSWKDSLSGGLVACFPNVAFMGLTIVFLLYPNNSLATAVAGLTVLVPTVSLVLSDVALSMFDSKESSFAAYAKKFWINISHNPSLIGASLGLIVGLGGFSFPEPLLNIAKMLGATAAPCALFCMGMSLKTQLNSWSHGININWKAQGIMLSGKLFITPLIVYVLSKSMGAQGVALATMTILSAMPTAVICHIIAMKHDALAEECANSVLVGTLLSMLTIPLIIALVV